MRSHNSPWPWQGKFPANEEYAKDIVTMTMKIGEEMVAGSLGALSKAITVPKSGKLIQTPSESQKWEEWSKPSFNCSGFARPIPSP